MQIYLLIRYLRVKLLSIQMLARIPEDAAEILSYLSCAFFVPTLLIAHAG